MWPNQPFLGDKTFILLRENQIRRMVALPKESGSLKAQEMGSRRNLGKSRELPGSKKETAFCSNFNLE
jgi:hypothetical protein